MGVASWDPRDMAKAGLLEVQSPAMKVRIHRKRTPETDATLCSGSNRTPGQPPQRGASSNEDECGDEWAAYVTLDTYSEECGAVGKRWGLAV